jgi:hypothetical protein
MSFCNGAWRKSFGKLRFWFFNQQLFTNRRAVSTCRVEAHHSLLSFLICVPERLLFADGEVVYFVPVFIVNIVMKLLAFNGHDGVSVNFFVGRINHVRLILSSRTG